MARRRLPPQPKLPEFIVADPADLPPMLDHLARCPVLGLDTEFVGEDSYRPDLCLVQVATPERLVLLDPLACGSLDEFWNLLLDPRRAVIVHAGREEVRMCRFAVGKPPAKVFDLQIASGLLGFNYPIGYAALVHDVLGVRMTKGETLTDWRRRPLSPNQIRYAFDDVRYLLPLYAWCLTRLRKHGRTAWADEEFATFIKRATGDEPGVERWRRVKGLGGLNRKELAVARELYEWREQFAARVNRPTRFILRDDLIIEIARRGISGPDNLSELRGLPRGELETIAAAVRRGLALAPGKYPEAVERDNDPPHVTMLSNLLNVVLNEFCNRESIAANLVATSSDLKSLVRSRQNGASPAVDSSLTSGWRATAVLPYLSAVLDGRAVLQVTNPANESPISVLALPEPPTVLVDRASVS